MASRRIGHTHLLTLQVTLKSWDAEHGRGEILYHYEP
jgi:hypothetical protein